MTMKKSGFTLVEIMIVVLIIGLLAAIAVPNFVKARKSAQRNACIDNLRQIEGAIEQSLMEGTTPSSVADLCGADKYIKKEPKCPTNPNGSSYTIDPTGDPQVACPNVGTYDDHVLPSATAAGGGDNT